MVRPVPVNAKLEEVNMENVPVIFLNGSNPPNATKDIQERYEKWSDEVYAPMLMKSGKLTGIDQYTIIKEIPDFPIVLSIQSLKNLRVWEEYWNVPEVIAVAKDAQTTWPKYGRENIWGAVYQQLLSFKGNVINFFQGDKPEGENPPVLNITAFDFSAIEWDKFNVWFGEFGPQAFLPLFSKLPGLHQCDCYKWTGITRPNRRIKEYPMFLMLFYFENSVSSQYFEVCPEMMSFKAAIKIAFPNGFNSQWNVQYQLVKSFRK